MLPPGGEEALVSQALLALDHRGGPQLNTLQFMSFLGCPKIGHSETRSNEGWIREDDLFFQSTACDPVCAAQEADGHPHYQDAPSSAAHQDPESCSPASPRPAWVATGVLPSQGQCWALRINMDLNTILKWITETTTKRKN